MTNSVHLLFWDVELPSTSQGHTSPADPAGATRVAGGSSRWDTHCRWIQPVEPVSPADPADGAHITSGSSQRDMSCWVTQPAWQQSPAEAASGSRDEDPHPTAGPRTQGGPRVRGREAWLVPPPAQTHVGATRNSSALNYRYEERPPQEMIFSRLSVCLIYQHRSSLCFVLRGADH